MSDDAGIGCGCWTLASIGSRHVQKTRYTYSVSTTHQSSNELRKNQLSIASCIAQHSRIPHRLAVMPMVVPSGHLCQATFSGHLLGTIAHWCLRSVLLESTQFLLCALAPTTQPNMLKVDPAKAPHHNTSRDLQDTPQTPCALQLHKKTTLKSPAARPGWHRL